MGFWGRRRDERECVIQNWERNGQKSRFRISKSDPKAKITTLGEIWHAQIIRSGGFKIVRADEVSKQPKL